MLSKLEDLIVELVMGIPYANETTIDDLIYMRYKLTYMKAKTLKKTRVFHEADETCRILINEVTHA